MIKEKIVILHVQVLYHIAADNIIKILYTKILLK